ncbi:hypothetical protein [Rickettsiales endosymbiont of Trichoplax sp. H2]|nr:hypothetical protein [Rickettsiales endosymbiont of Trichoplax sp. H2]MSO14334.1 hypothetical protein [Rickettsiales endosymbiont of Trichoplax sp. H2]
MPKLKINNKEIEVPEGFTVIQAREKAGVEIPIILIFITNMSYK